MEEFLARYGGVAVFLGAMLEGDLSIVMAGVVAHLGYLNLATALQTAWLGAFAGDAAWYALGRVRATAVTESGLYRRAAPSIERLVARLGDREIVLARFVYGTRIASMFFWGVRRLPFPRFAALDLVGCLLSVTCLVLLGYGLSETAVALFGHVQRVERWAVTVLAAGTILVLVGRAVGRRAARARSPARWVSASVTRVVRSLRFQLIAIVLATVATVLVAEQVIDTRLSEGALERDLKERGLLYLRTVDSLWGRTGVEGFRRELKAMVEGDREVTAIDVLRWRGGRLEPTITTRTPREASEAGLAPADEATLLRDGFVRVDLIGRDGGTTWRMAMPVARGGGLVGAVQVEFSLAEVDRLEHSLRLMGFALLAASIVLISLLLGLFLERRVARPVAELVDGMRQAERGKLGARVSVAGGGEFAVLAGSLNRMLGRIEDLTASLESRVREATSALAEKNRELEEANENLWRAQLEVGRSERLAALGQMAATIAHELGTPLNSVLGYTQLLRREDPNPVQASRLEVIESQVQRMIETIRSVLDRTRDREITRVPVRIAPLVSEAVGLISTRLADRDLVMRSDIPPELPPVPGDAAALRQVLINLLANAVDATEPPGTITVAARVLAANGRGEQLEVTVEDSGHGMASDEIRRVFEPFYTTKAPGRGTGLGLAIVDHIVRAHGGQVLVDSVPGRGTTMHVRLPLEP